jgi:intracellular multiplication protein IcmC
VQLVGTIAFIRGLVLLTHASGHGTQPGTFSKAISFIVAGILCINLYQFLQVIFTTFGLGTLSP